MSPAGDDSGALVLCDAATTAQPSGKQVHCYLTRGHRQRGHHRHVGIVVGLRSSVDNADPPTNEWADEAATGPRGISPAEDHLSGA